MTDSAVRAGRCQVHSKTVLSFVSALMILLLYAAYGHIGKGNHLKTDYMDREQWNKVMYNATESHAMKQKQMAAAVKKVRLLCLILTMEKDLNTKAAAVNKTWATRCDKHFYVIYSTQKRHDFLNVAVPDDRHKLVFKMRKAYEEVYQKYINDFDFLLKADDDTYVIVENLKYLLWHHDANKPGYLGFHFNKFVNSGYMSGGAGYVISNRGLRNLVERGYQNGVCELQKRKDDPENSEDIETGRCLETAGVPVWTSLDLHGRETFHAYPLERHLFGNLPQYIYSWAKHPIRNGKECCSRYAISYHYVKPDAIYFLHHMLYETTVFGLADNLEINGPVFKFDRIE
ncbi:glycoprotein-N-acetylgalactosamine 3-beta-galactosyltransferase 1-like isoform X2 [Mercenaria mercenaria]|uniref:glycoprotein-N-acetylgalactosamine 3-beta-galactosyltransferase 1-like isoform X2 n=1 Tax=Mercenaria mercenaria TaxID=6596 RepID=UPI00234F5E57|nr:glycoprotein-N-acetylgalactosamine 3-beta-galactosyltransferase 1-like isoform X2 [Mercenaria mercenaria]